MARFGAFFDACVLVPIGLADTLLRLADREMYRPLWSDRVLGEVRRTVLRLHPDMDASRFDARLQSMDAAFPDAQVEGWEPLEAAITLPDPDDRHVLAAAIRGRADVIVTRNLKDFPTGVLEPFGLAAVDPDTFLLDQLDLARHRVVAEIKLQAAVARRPSMTAQAVCESLARGGAPQFAASVAQLLEADGATE